MAFTYFSNISSLEEFVEQGTEIGFDDSRRRKSDMPESAYEEKELKDILIKALDGLTEKERKVIELYYYEELTLKEIEEIKDYITGQNSDGLGEGFEQQDIEIDGSVMNVHFWESGKDYRIYDEDEFEAEIRSDQGMGGLS